MFAFDKVKLFEPATLSAPPPEMTPAKLSALTGATVKVLPVLMAKLPLLLLPFKSVRLKVFCALKVPLSVKASMIAPDTVSVAPELTVVPPV